MYFSGHMHFNTEAIALENTLLIFRFIEREIFVFLSTTG